MHTPRVYVGKIAGWTTKCYSCCVRLGSVMRYWLCFDLGFQGSYQDLFAWLDKMGAKECGENVATFLSAKTRQTITKELEAVLQVRAEHGGLPTSGEPRVYLINRKRGGKFVIGKRKIAPWTGYARALVDSGEEK